MVLRRLGSLVALVVLAVLAGPLPAHAAQPTALTVTAGPAAFAGEDSSIAVRLTTGDGAGVPGATVQVERRIGGTWQSFTALTTDAQGAASAPVTLRRVAADNVLRARFAGTATHAGSQSIATQLLLKRRVSTVGLGAPATLVDGRTATLTITRQTGNGEPVPGPVRLDVRRGNGDWQRHSSPTLGADGRAGVTIQPTTDTRWRVVAPAQDWVEGAVSPTRFIDLLPSGDPVRLPADAPRPKVSVPAQPRAVGAGPNAVVSRIPDGIWRNMVGRSWHRGCPVGRAGLRLVRVNYWSYSGWRRRGELVVAAGAADNAARAMSSLYRQNIPFRSIYRVDRFGWSDRLQGADDYKSMRAGNTSAFNCRSVVGRPGIRSPHATGRALDLNTWENPYHSADGWVPNRWWASRSHGRVAWRSRSHPVVSTMAGQGFRWTYGVQDSQHFDLGSGSGRAVIDPRCVDVICD